MRHFPIFHGKGDGPQPSEVGDPTDPSCQHSMEALASEVRSTNSAWADEKSADLNTLSRSATVHDYIVLKRILHARQKRAQHFDGAMFADPAWDILLRLARAEIEYNRVTITELCLATVVPPTTALRWIRTMTESGVLARQADAFDRRRFYITLSGKISAAMKSYLASLD